MKILLLITLMIIFNSCIEEIQNEDAGLPCCTTRDISILLNIKNNVGEDLLNPSTSGYYKHSNIKHYQITDGVKKMLGVGNEIISNPDPPEKPYAEFFDYGISTYQLGKKIKVAPYPVYESFLELDSNTIDTLKVETLEKVSKYDPSLVTFQTKRKIWYNGKLIWEVHGDNKWPLTIVK